MAIWCGYVARFAPVAHQFIDPDERGHRVDRSDIGVLLGNVRHLQREGTTTVVAKERLAGRETTHISVMGPENRP